MSDPRRRIPGVDRLLASEAFGPLLERYPQARVAERLRREIAGVRERMASGASPGPLDDPERWARWVHRALVRDDTPSLRSVVNATGVVLHTNLGRAPLSRAARRAMGEAAGYGNLEFDLEEGTRGSRYVHCADLLAELTGAEDGLVVNNNAGALVLALNTLARGARVLVSRGELVEIGGGFRVPEIIERAGASLVEVGSTNRTRLEDYRSAEMEGLAAILKVHRSNFRVSGFTEEASLSALSTLAAERSLPLVHDLGSGLLADPDALGLPAEPRPRESLEAGADVVAFSGDKLLGGPQAGLLVGRADLVERMKRNPLCRALRADKVTLAGLEATLRAYRDPDRALGDIPVLRLLSAGLDELEERARALADALVACAPSVEVIESASVIGGGTYPGVELPTRVVRLRPAGGSADRLAARLRGGEPPVVPRIEDDHVVLDVRTIFPEQDAIVVERVRECLGGA